MTSLHYDGLTRALHWITALLVVLIYALGLGREALPKGDVRILLLGLHMSLGICLLALVMVRIGWRIIAPAIEPMPLGRGAELAAKGAHLALYLLLIGVPLSGMLAAWFKGRTVGFFGLALSSPFTPDRAMGGWLEDVHEVGGHAIIILAGLHAIAALGHHFLLRDNALRRMMPQRRAP